MKQWIHAFLIVLAQIAIIPTFIALFALFIFLLCTYPLVTCITGLSTIIVIFIITATADMKDSLYPPSQKPNYKA